MRVRKNHFDGEKKKTSQLITKCLNTGEKKKKLTANLLSWAILLYLINVRVWQMKMYHDINRSNGSKNNKKKRETEINICAKKITCLHKGEHEGIIKTNRTHFFFNMAEQDNSHEWTNEGKRAQYKNRCDDRMEWRKKKPTNDAKYMHINKNFS